ncbi:MAG: [FeFe] hydrogenase H-cluster radical SAM maturase HydE [Deltaproteobacteria bacterium]|nr:[FeFe] hydrogenase H-cluster radical SAM maturase HydE [Deltaproteobacteria bacterium]
MSDKNSITPLNVDEIYTFFTGKSDDELKKLASDLTLAVHGKDVLLRGLIEYSNYCTQDCLYCGIRAENDKITRYRLNEEQLLQLVNDGFAAGFRTFVLQGGEDPVFDVKTQCRIVEKIKTSTNGECAVTLSSGMLKRDELLQLKSAGADRYLLRFETSDEKNYSYLKCGESLSKRLGMLSDLKELDYQVGSGFMTGLPGETDEILIKNLQICSEFNFDMVGIGPFIPNPDTPLGNLTGENINIALKCVSMLRLALPFAHIPATTAAGSIDQTGREKMIEHGANVLMPNLTPVSVKANYLLYPGKICLDESGQQCVGCMSLRMKSIGRNISFNRGDALRLNH